MCLGAANWELVQRRRELLKSQICHLCAKNVAFTDMLFGDNVTKQIKDITDDNKVTHKLLDQKYVWKREWKGNSRGNYSIRGRIANRATHGRGRFTPYQKPSLGQSSSCHQGYSKWKTTAETTTKKA